MNYVSHHLFRECRKTLQRSFFHPPRLRQTPGLCDSYSHNEPQRRTIADLSTYLRALGVPLTYLPAATDAPHVKQVQEALALSEKTDATLKEMQYKRLWSIKSITILPEIPSLTPHLPNPIVLRCPGPPLHIRLTRNEGLTLFVDIREEAKKIWYECLIEQRKKLEESVKYIPTNTQGFRVGKVLWDILERKIGDSEGDSWFTPSVREVYCLPFYAVSTPDPDSSYIGLQLPREYEFEQSTTGQVFANSFVIEFNKHTDALQFTRFFRAAAEENQRFWEVQALASWALGKRREEMGLLPAIGVKDLAMDYAFKQLSMGTFKRKLWTDFDLSNE